MLIQCRNTESHFGVYNSVYNTYFIKSIVFVLLGTGNSWSIIIAYGTWARKCSNSMNNLKILL